MKITTRDRLATAFYWLGVVMTIAAIGLVLLANTKQVYPLQHRSFPLAWKFAGIAVVAFLAREICRPTFHLRRERQDSDRQSLEHIPYEI